MSPKRSSDKPGPKNGCPGSGRGLGSRFLRPVRCPRVPDRGELARDRRARRLAPGAVCTAAAVILGVTIFWNGMVLIGAQKGGLFAIPIIAIFGLFGLLFVYMTIDVWLGTRRLRARRGMLRVTHKILGIGGTRSYAADEVQGFSLEISGHMGSTPYYDLALKRKGKTKPTSLAGGIADKGEAERLLDLVRQAFGGS